MKKIGLVTLYNSDNYGAMLQAYALQQSIISCGCICEIVSHNRFGAEISRNPSVRNSKLARLYSGVKLALRNPGFVRLNLERLSKRKKWERKRQKLKCEAFRDEYLSQRSYIHYQSAEQIKTDPPLCDGFVCGSDQIWNPERINGSGPFFLDFVPEGLARIAYAPSIGVDTIPQEFWPLYKERISNFDAVSVRESDGCSALKEATRISVECVLDPTFLLDQQEWQSLANHDVIKGNYIFCYFLSKQNLASMRKQINRIAKEKKAKVVILPAPYKAIDKGWMTIYDAGPKEFLGLISQALIVLTDSFHGTALSIQLKKDFCTYNGMTVSSYAKRFGRVENILKICGLQDRVISEKSCFPDTQIDYQSVGKKIWPEIQKSKAFLQDALDQVEPKHWPVRKEPDYLASKETCTGCGACAAVCKTGALVMQQEESGFWHPQVNMEKCVKCGQCVKLCPVRHPLNVSHQDLFFKAVWATDPLQRTKGSSGNAFGLLSNLVLQDGGVVYGAAMGDDCRTLSCRSTDEVPLEKIQKSKYYESAMLNVYQRIEQDLARGKRVLFCGTPCQVIGMRVYFGKNDKLILCDFICHGVPSEKCFGSYLSSLEKKYRSKAVRVSFRSKALGWKTHCIQVDFENGNKYFKTRYADPYFIDFFTNRHLRTSCYACTRVLHSAADISLGDYWAVSSKKNIPDTDEGISVVVLRTSCGKQLFAKLEDSRKGEVWELSNKDVDETYTSRMRNVPKNNDVVPKSFPMKNKYSLRQITQIIYYELFLKNLYRVGLMKRGKA